MELYLRLAHLGANESEQSRWPHRVNHQRNIVSSREPQSRIGLQNHQWTTSHITTDQPMVSVGMSEWTGCSRHTTLNPTISTSLVCLLGVLGLCPHPHPHLGDAAAAAAAVVVVLTCAQTATATGVFARVCALQRHGGRDGRQVSQSSHPPT